MDFKTAHTHRSLMWLLSGCLILFTACQDEPKPESQTTELASVESLWPANVRAIFKRSCESCHGLDGRGIKGIAPDLRQTATRSVTEWEAYLREPQSAHPGTQMPAPVWLTADEIKVIAAFLTDLNAPK